jgi:hypothetical protein
MRDVFLTFELFSSEHPIHFDETQILNQPATCRPTLFRRLFIVAVGFDGGRVVLEMGELHVPVEAVHGKGEAGIFVAQPEEAVHRLWAVSGAHHRDQPLKLHFNPCLTDLIRLFLSRENLGIELGTGFTDLARGCFEQRG